MKERLKRLLPKNKFARAVSVLAGGTAAGQVIVVAASPLLTRLYSPEDFGLLAVYAGLLGILGVVASLRYQLAIPLPESDEEAAAVTVLSLLVVLGVTLLCTVAVAVWGQDMALLLNTPALTRYLWLLPVGLLLVGTYQVLNYWAIRAKAFPAIARTKLTQAGAMVCVQIGGFALGPVSLLLGQAAGHAAGSTSLGMLVVRHRWSIFEAITGANVVAAAKRYRRFPLYSSWAGAFNTAGVQLPLVSFAVLFNPAAAGIYMLAHRVLAMPIRLLGKAIADVFYSQAASAHRDARLAPLVASIHANLARVAMLPALILVIAGPDLFALVFGDDWRQSGEFARWMAPWIYLVFVTSPLSTLFAVMEKQAQGMLFQATLLLVRVLSIIVGAAASDLMLAVALFAMSSAVCWVGFLGWIFHASGNRLRDAIVPSLSTLMLCGLLVSPLAACYAIDPSLLFVWLAVSATVLVVMSYYVRLVRLAWL